MRSTSTGDEIQKKSKSSIISVEELNQHAIKRIKGDTISYTFGAEIFQTAMTCSKSSATSTSWATIERRRQLRTQPTMQRKLRPSQSAFTLFNFIIFQLFAALLLLFTTVLTSQNCVYAMSKRFLKGFIMGAMFAHHHKP